MLRLRSGITVLALLLTAAASGEPPSKAEKAIEYRHSVYHVIAWNFVPMAAAATGKIPYDKDAFLTQATRVALLAPMLPEGFPAGSYVAGKTEAKPAIWKERADFDELMHALATKSAALAEVAKSGDIERIKPAFNELAQACKNCHKKFREEESEGHTHH